MLKTLLKILKPKKSYAKPPAILPSSYLNFQNIQNSQIEKFLSQQNLPYKLKPSGQIVIKACPLCKKPHNNETSNLWTLNIKQNSGAFLCFRCGTHGSWNEFVRNFIADGLYRVRDVGDEEIKKERKEGKEVVGRVFAEKRENFRICLEFYMARERGFEEHKGKEEEFCENRAFEEKSDFEGENGEYFFSKRERIIGEKYLEIIEYLIQERHFTKETLFNFEIGIGEEMFKDEDNNLKLVKCIYFPMKTREMIRKDEKAIVTKLKIKGIGRNKKYLRIFPTGADFGFFGTNIFENKEEFNNNENDDKINLSKEENKNNLKINETKNNIKKEERENNQNNCPENLINSEEKIFSENFSEKVLVITEGEYDAMAINQVTNLNCVSLPFGASNLPYKLLDFIEKFERIYLWMDFDSMGQMNIETFCEKIGKSRTYVVKEINMDILEKIFGKKLILEKNEKTSEKKTETISKNEIYFTKKIKDANDALKHSPSLIWYYLKNSEALPKKNIINFTQLRQKVKQRFLFADSFRGLKSSYFPWFNKNLKGFRRGE